MKIGIVCPYDIFRSGGVQEHVLAQADELRLRGYSVKIITPRPRKHDAEPTENIIFVGNSANIKTPYKTSLELGITMGRSTVEELVLVENFDLIHIHEPEIPILGAQIIAKTECPIIATFHAIHPETTVTRTIEVLRIPYGKSIFNKLSALTAVSEVAASFVRQHTNKPIHIIPNGIDIHKYGTLKNSYTNTILYIGRLEKRKGVQYLLQAFALLSEQFPGVELIIAGDGPQRKKLEEYISEHKIPRVRMLGYVTEDKKRQLLSEASVFTSPAIYGESFGIVLLEAMASKVPIVAADNLGYQSVLTGRGLLSLVDVKNSDEYARRLQLLLTDQEIRNLWLEWSENYIQKFSYKKIVDAYEELYIKAVS